MTKIPLPKGRVALIDDEDADVVRSLGPWRVATNGYVMCGQSRDHNTRYLHHVVLPPVAGLDTDHINGDKLDNRKANLRRVTHSQNMMNARRSPAHRNPARGVTWHLNRWEARIKVNKQTICLGRFENFDDAVAARRAGEVEHFGEYRRGEDL
jgi:HNH endonuclease